jgi:hypothetical protein
MTDVEGKDFRSQFLALQGKTVAEINAWLDADQARRDWYNEVTGLNKSPSAKKRKNDKDTSAVVQAELPIEGPTVWAKTSYKDSEEAISVGVPLATEYGGRIFIKHVATHVSEWGRDENGRLIPSAYAPLYRKGAFFRTDGSQKRVRDSFWTDRHGIKIPDELARQIESRSEPGELVVEGHEKGDDFELVHENGESFYVKKFIPKYHHFGTHDEWWAHRDAVLGTDPDRKPIGQARIAEIKSKWAARRSIKEEKDREAIAAGFEEAPEVEPIVAPEVEPETRDKTFSEMVADGSVRKRKKEAFVDAIQKSGMYESLKKEIAAKEEELARCEDLLEKGRAEYKEARAAYLAVKPIYAGCYDPVSGKPVLSEEEKHVRKLRWDNGIYLHNVRKLSAEILELQKTLSKSYY